MNIYKVSQTMTNARVMGVFTNITSKTVRTGEDNHS